MRRGGAEFAATAGMELRRGDELVVPPSAPAPGGPDGAGAVLTLADATRAAVGPDTEVAIGAVLADESGAADLELRSGFLSVESAERPAGDPLHVRTPEADVAVRGTRFTVAAGRRKTHLRVSSGRVSVRRLSDGATAEVGAGCRSTVGEGAARRASRAEPGACWSWSPRPPATRRGTGTALTA